MSWTVAAHAVMPACARAPSAWPAAAAIKPASAGPGTVPPAFRRPACARAAAHEPGVFWSGSDPGRDVLCTLTSPLRWLQWR
jgi:hypothetical protein